MSHIESSVREIGKELTVDTEYLDMMGRDMMCAYQPGIHEPGPAKNEISNRRNDVSPWIPIISFTV